MQRYDEMVDENNIRYYKGTYKHFGYEQELVIHHKDAKKNLEHKLKSRVKRVARTELNGGNTFKEINTCLSPLSATISYQMEQHRAGSDEQNYPSTIHRSQETSSEYM